MWAIPRLSRLDILRWILGCCELLWCLKLSILGFGSLDKLRCSFLCFGLGASESESTPPPFLCFVSSHFLYIAGVQTTSSTGNVGSGECVRILFLFFLCFFIFFLCFLESSSLPGIFTGLILFPRGISSSESESVCFLWKKVNYK